MYICKIVGKKPTTSDSRSYRVIITTLSLILVLLGAVDGARGAERASIEDFSMREFTMNDGLPNDHVTTLMCDSKGFVWLGFAGGGVSRFDGYEFVNFDENSETRRLRSNFVKSIAEDTSGRIWVAGECGVDLIDRETLSRVELSDKTGRFKDMAKRHLTDVMVDAEGALWLSGHEIVYRIETGQQGEIVRIDTLNVPGSFHRGIAVRDIEQNGNVWLAIGNTIHRVRPGQETGLNAVPVSVSISRLPDVEYVSDMVERGGEVWISTDRGLFRYDLTTDMVKHYGYEADNEHSLTQNFLTDIAITGNNRLLVSSLRGVNLYNPLNDDFYHIGEGVNSQFVSCMLSDGNRLFIGTEGHGLLLLTPKRLNVKTISHDSYDPSSLSANPVNAIAESEDGTLWVGTVEGGLNVKRPGEERFNHITTADGRLNHNSVSALALDSRGRIWVGTWGGGIDILSSTPPYEVVMRLNPFVLDRNVSYIGSLVYDGVNDGVVVGSNAGLLYYDLDNGTLVEALPAGSGVDAFGFVGAIIDHDGRLWMGSAQGLVMLNLNERHADGTFSYEFIRNRFDNSGPDGVEKPVCFYETSDSTMWIGTNGHGIYRVEIDPGTGDRKFIRYTTDDGLSNNTVRGVVGDTAGNIWITTVNGLSRYNPADNHFVNYTVNDGLPDNQFYWNSSMSTKDGRMLLGTTKGIAEIQPENTVADPERFQVVFTRLAVGSRSMPSVADTDGREVAFVDNISVHERDKSLAVEFSALDFTRRDNATYSYRLVGFDKEWVRAEPSHRVASYTNLAPGDYVLQVRYQPEGYDSGAPISELKITVRPFFYRTNWFIVLVVIVVAAMMVAVYLYRVAALKRHSRELKLEVEKSTSQLVERNERLQAQNEEIQSQKAQLTEMNRRVSEMNMDRIQFFTGITHEFRTPLTLIIGPIERALKLSTNPKVIEQLNFVERNSKYLLSLVNQLMDFRKIESGKMSVAYTRGDIMEFVKGVVTPFIPMAADRGIKLRELFHTGDRREIIYDEESLRKILINLISNAIKFTPDNGCVTVYVAAIQDNAGEGNGKIYLSVSDTGCGVPPEDVDRIFERFYQVEGQLKYPLPGAGDSGIGLYLCRTIVELHGGTISVSPNHGAGSTFRVLLPVPSEAATKLSLPQTGNVSSGADALAGNYGEETVILVVEDNADMRRFIRSILQDKYKILEAKDGNEALTILSCHHVDFIISDLMMPNMDGVELSRRVKENFATSHIPFLILTAKTTTDVRIDSYRIGVDDYLLKPFDEQVLLARIEGILRSRRLLQSKFGENMDAEVLETAAESRDKKFIDQVMETLKANYRNSYFEVGDFADALGISRSLLNKKLQSLMGQSAGQLVRNYRLNIARELILKNRETKAMNISEIAYEVGFNDSKYFTRCFTKQYNVTPSALISSTQDD